MKQVKIWLAEKLVGKKLVNVEAELLRFQWKFNVSMNNWFHKYNKKTQREGALISNKRFLEIRDEFNEATNKLRLKK